MRNDGTLKNLKSNQDAIARLASILATVGDSLKEIAVLLNPSPSLTHHGQSRKTLVDLTNELLVSKAAAGIRDRSLIQLRHALSLFAEGRMHRPIETITAAEIEEWMLEKDWAPATRLSYLTDVRSLFNFAVRRDYLDRSPADGVERPRLDNKPPGIHTPEQAAAMLQAAQADDPDVMRILAIQYFAGLRPSEALQLSQSNILPAGFVEVQGAKSKSRQRRLVKIEPALSAYLVAGGSLPVINFTRRFRKVRARAGIGWSHDVTRHSFASYHLAHFKSADRTAHEMGHRSTAMLFSNYRELVLPDAAEKFWAIRPR